MLLLFIFALPACSATASSDNEPPIAAVEIPVPAESDKSALIALLRQAASRQGFHVDDGSMQWRDFARQAKDLPPEARKTIYAGVWNGENDDDLIAVVDDGEHNGRAWVIVYPGKRPTAAKRFWRDVYVSVSRRWPSTKAIPILPSGALPLFHDLTMTLTGYRVARSAAKEYELNVSSPQIANDR
ncbi:MAG: hypothetical protein PGN16_17990 [Sphingomonas phyllosphaerae]|uniref:hypothetical protein n=1 Tax=Sphingomonas phyllosphaerae TaxID=257003 RepID=UPI002FFCF1EC